MMLSAQWISHIAGLDSMQLTAEIHAHREELLALEAADNERHGTADFIEHQYGPRWPGVRNHTTPPDIDAGPPTQAGIA